MATLFIKGRLYFNKCGFQQGAYRLCRPAGTFYALEDKEGGGSYY